MRPTEILVPDLLWRDRSLPDGAKLLWCYLSAAQGKDPLRCAAVRGSLKICRNSLRKYLALLVAKGWLDCSMGAHAFFAQVRCPGNTRGLQMPSDLLLDRRVPGPAVWIWCNLRDHAGSFRYDWLQEITGYSRPTLIRNLNILRATGWLIGNDRRVDHYAVFDLRVCNPFDEQRKADIADLEKGMATARRTQGYSLGQYLLARMVKFRLAHGTVMENVEVTGLDNPATGGRMHYDIFIPEFKLAIEFNGWQHESVTELYPDIGALRARRQRDLMKRGIAVERGDTLLVVTPLDLSFERLDELLAGHVPLKPRSDDQWHIREHLEQSAAEYRKKAALARRPSFVEV